MPGMKGTMDEYKAGTLHSGSKTGPKVTSRKQAIAIGISEEKKAHNSKRAKMHPSGAIMTSHSMVSGSAAKPKRTNLY